MRNQLLITPNNLNIMPVIGDGNCLFKVFQGLYTGPKIYIFYRVRREIYNEALARSNNYPDITLDIEDYPIHIHEYITHMKDNDFLKANII